MEEPWLWVWLLATPIALALISLGGTGKSSDNRAAARATGDGRTTHAGPVGGHNG